MLSSHLLFQLGIKIEIEGKHTPESKSMFPAPMRAKIISGESFGELAKGVRPSNMM